MADILDGRFVLLGVPTRAGGFGDVRKAVDSDADGRPVAIKYLRSSHPDDPLARLQFDREVASLSRLQIPQPHPNIVELISAGFDEHSGKQYIVLEWIEDDLHGLLAKKPWTSWDEFAADFGLPLSDALSYAHLREVQHRDIKPENVLIADGVPKLADFGIAKRQDIVEASGRTLFEAHTPPYAPPDKGVGAEYTRDVWALAVLMIRCMYDRPLVDYPDIATALDEIDVPSDIRSLLRRCVDMDPQARPQNGSVLARDLKEVQERRVARAARGHSAVWLVLTTTALNAVMGKAGQDRLEGQQRVLMDLAGGWYARYQIDQETERVDRQTLIVYGRDWQYVLKHDIRTSKFVIVGARRGTPEYHAKDCARANEMTGVVDLAFQGLSSAKAEAGARLLIDALEAHAASAAQAREARARIGAENRYFEDLLELLDAQEELAQGDRRPIQFRSRRIRGREVEFELTVTPEQDLVGQEWDIRVGRNHRVGRGEVVRQGSQSLTLLLARHPRNVPEHGELAPNLGASQVAHDRQADAVQKVRDGAAVRPDLRELLLASTFHPPTG